MKTVPRESIRNAVIMTIVVILATVLVATVDVQPVGVEGTDLGFATINTGFFNKFGENHTFYTISKLAGFICFGTAGGFAVFFLLQLIQRKNLLKVDPNLTVLIMLYVMTVII